MALRYQHTQVGWWIFALAGPLMLVATVLALRDAFAGGVIVAVLAMVILLSLFSLTTAVSENDVRVWFGIGLISRRIALNQITSARTVTTHWIYGWGIRWIPGGWLWNVSGLDGVELALVNGRRFRIGTDEPERLAAAIQEMIRNERGSR
jgi:hypothetical protein